MDNVLYELQDSEPSFMQANSQVIVDRERSRCVQTEDVEEAAELLEDTGRVILCGFPGTGKTTVGHALLRRWREEGFKPYILSKLEDWHTHIGPGRRSVVLIDGLLGKVRVDRQQHDRWNSILQSMLELMKKKECRVVLTVYPHVLHELRQLESECRSPVLDKSAVVWLMKGDLDTAVKRQVLDFHLTQLGLQPSQQLEVVERIVQADSSGPAFLWCCRYLLDHWQAVEDPATVFTSPAEAYSVLLRQMCLHETHGDSFAALFVLTMLGKGRFLQTKVRAQVELLEHGFQGQYDDHLAKYEGILLGSVLSTKGHEFISRVMYDAAGLALGRSHRLPTLLRVCDATFLVQNVFVYMTEGQMFMAEGELTIQVGSKPFAQNVPNDAAILNGSQPLIERLHEELAKGNLETISKQPALQCPVFLAKLEEHCMKNKHRENHLLGVLDAQHGLPLIYWSVGSQCHVLSEWCIRKMTADTDLQLVLHKTLLACAVSPHLTGQTNHTAEQLAFIRLFTEENCLFPGNTVVLSHEFVAGDSMKTDASLDETMTGAEKANQKPDDKVAMETHAVFDETSGAGKAEQLLQYLFNTSTPIQKSLIRVQKSEDPALPASAPMTSILVSRDTVSVQVSDSKDWYLALRLLADRDVDQTDRDGNTLLHIAAHRGNLEAITLAVKSGASLTQKNNKGLTPYQLAKLSQENCNNARSRDWLKGAFFSAICGGDEVWAKELLCYGISVEDKNHAGDTGLIIACREGHGNIADLMIHLGADVNAVGRDKYFLSGLSTALHQACWKGLSGTAELLIRHNADINARDERKQTALHHACQCESPTASADITRLLLNAGADVKARDRDDNTPLHWASRNGHTDSVKVLIYHGADVNARRVNSLNLSNIFRITDKDSATTLHAACGEGHTETVECLLPHGADVSAVTEDCGTPLHSACREGHTETVECLLHHGADVNAVSEDRGTPLHSACRDGHTEIVERLLQHGADVNAVSVLYGTPLHAACGLSNTKTVECLLQHGADVNAVSGLFGTPLHAACALSNTKTVECLLQHKADVNAVSGRCGTPLYTACELGKTETVECLLQHGADVNAVSEEYGTPLHTACTAGHLQTVECLLQHGANVNAVSEQHGTPLDMAMKFHHDYIVKLLTQQGAVSRKQL